MDPTNAIMENNCKKIRGIDSDNILEGRLVYHYNGHGVPDPTPSGEIWVFDPNYNQYVPISIYVLHVRLSFSRFHPFLELAPSSMLVYLRL